MRNVLILIPRYLLGLAGMAGAFVLALMIYGAITSRSTRLPSPDVGSEANNPSTTSDKPDPAKFDTHAQYVEALMSWKLAQLENAKATVGRFQLIQLGTLRRDQFLLDTTAGRIFRPACKGKQDKFGACEGSIVWQEDEVEIPR